MTPEDKQFITSALRKAILILETDMGEGLSPVPVKRKKVNKYMEQIERNYATGTWRKPEELKNKKIKKK
jgi:hypothetical protein